MKELQKVYDPKTVEEKLYSMWERAGYFHANADSEKEPYTIVIPPPNVTGQLHMGHALDNVLQDVLIRRKRMQGYETLWMPGTDHASIATEVKIVEEMAKEGLTKQAIGREKFMERAWAWKTKYGNRIIEQLKKMGSSCDWERERFTMDEGCSEAVKEVFVRLYEKGLIYKGNRIINWCPDCKTALSDAEVEYEEEDSHLWHIRYSTPDGKASVVVATTRPETMLGDTAVAVHPEDERYKELVGKMVVLPIVNREIPIVADEYVDREFGTGAVKITPAHDPNDFEVAVRHELPMIRVLDDSGRMNAECGEFCGMDRLKAREEIVKRLQEQGSLVKVEAYRHNVGHCYRCGTTCEPLTSDQWFVRMKPLAEPAMQAVRDGKIRFVPARFEKIYFNWMENVRDWCISRQLWWGHRIPAYYCDDCGEIIVSRETPTVCPKCHSTHLHQDEDVLDTWFSSGLWPFSTLGWPHDTKELKKFYPTNVLVTGYEIIFFWVARMIVFGLEVMGEIPFDTVMIHGIVRDDKGRKMSKSLGNGIDPLEIIQQYGTDALRLSLILNNSIENDMRFYTEKVESCRNFSNKLWNAARFVLMNAQEEDIVALDSCTLTQEDRWILHRLDETIAEVDRCMDHYDLGVAAQSVYDFFWNDYCDWYIEMAKSRFQSSAESRKSAVAVLLFVLKNILKMLHPYIPFVTEEIYQNLPQTEGSIMVSDWPKPCGLGDAQDAATVEGLMDTIRSIRNIRRELNIPGGKKAPLYILPIAGKEQIFMHASDAFVRLAMGSELHILSSMDEVQKGWICAISSFAQSYLPLEELIDLTKERARIAKEKQRLMNEIARAKGKLGNEAFIQKAPAAVVEKERKALEESESTLAHLEQMEKALG